MNYQDRPQFINLMDMFDGGGAGRSGDRFEGGGLLSFLGNSMTRPAGYEDRLRDRKNSTGRAIATAVQEMTGGAPSRSMRPKMRAFTPQNLPNDVPTPAPMQDPSRELVGMDADAMDFQRFLQDLRLKEQVYGLPATPLAEAEMMFEQVRQQRIAQGIGSSGFTAPVAPPVPNPLPRQTPSLFMPGY